jgi:hypothetical protein
VSTTELARGSRWRCVTRTHFGQEVEVLALRSRSVRVRPVGGAWSRAQRSNVWVVPTARFIRQCAPVS